MVRVVKKTEIVAGVVSEMVNASRLHLALACSPHSFLVRECYHHCHAGRLFDLRVASDVLKKGEWEGGEGTESAWCNDRDGHDDLLKDVLVHWLMQ